MINLLPENYRHDLKRLYQKHIFLTGLFLFLLATVVATVLLLPSYFVFSVKSNEVAEMLGQLKNSAPSKDADMALGTILTTNKELAYLKTAATTSVETILSRIVSHAKNVSLVGISRNGNIIGIRGTSPNRDALISFTDALKADTLFAKIESPISNLIAERDIKFAVDATLK